VTRCVPRCRLGWNSSIAQRRLCRGCVAATRLLRVEASPDGDLAVWQQAPAAKWTARSGWQPYLNAQLEIQQLGEYLQVGRNEVLDIQRQMRDRVSAWQR